jgi:lipid A 3-O-deacylase
MNRWLFLKVVAVVLLGGFCGALASDQPEEGTTGENRWRFEFANDVLFGSDNQFTNGFTIQRHSRLFDRKEDIRGFPFGKWLAKRILPDRESLYYRNGFTIGQNMQTPDDIDDPDIILNDVPYVGMLGAGNTWIAFDDQRFSGFEVLFGVVGEYSFAEELQSGVHEIIGSDEPMGWDHQLDDEPILNFYYMWKRKMWNKPAFDGAFSLDLGAGNFFSGGTAMLEMRFGKKPKGFSYLPNPLGVALHYDATLPDSRRTIVYGSIAIRATGIGLIMLRDGNTFVDDNEWTENNVIDPKDVVGAVVAGFHYVRPKWGLHLNWWLSGDTVDDATLPVDQDAAQDFSTFVIEWKF